MQRKTTDLVIVGGGSGGYACALRAAQLGQSVVLVEQDRLGGTCLHRGCIPTKALLHTAGIADAVRHGNRFGVTTELLGIDMGAVHAYKNDVVNKLHRGLQGLIRSRRVDLVTGFGALADPHTVVVGDTTITASNTVLATGSHAKTLPEVPLGDRIITSDEALNWDSVPASVVIIGGGVIGVEFASLWRSFGAQVSIVEALPRLLVQEDELASNLVERAFRRRGITVRTSAVLRAVAQSDKDVTITLESGETLVADLLMVSVGRAPNTAGQGFEEAGVRLDGGHVVVDKNLRTSADNVFAVGDIVAGPQLAHRGFQQGIYVADYIAGLQPERVDEALIPRVTFCEPEVASVGLTEAAARDKYGELHCVTYDLSGNGKSQILGTQGAVKLVKAGPRGYPGPVVGIHMVGSGVSELIGEAQLICSWEAESSDVTPFIHAHPTQTEALGEAHLALAGKALHAHG